MANVSRGIINPPNETSKHGNLEHSSGGLSSQAPWDNAPNNSNKTSRVNSCGPMGRGGSPVNPPNGHAKFNVGNARAGYDG